MGRQCILIFSVYSPLLTQKGLAPHLALEYSMRGEGGEDPRVLTAMDPLTMLASPNNVALSLAQVRQ